MPFGIGIWELLILLLVLLLVFGPKRLPEMGPARQGDARVQGVGVRQQDDDDVDDIAELPPAEPSATATTSRERDTVS